jgi:phosphomannomutase
MAVDPQLIVSVSGIRGVVGQSLTPGVAVAFAGALGQHTNGGKIVLSRDGRPSGTMLRHAIVSGLLAAGCEIHDLGVAPTPTVGLAVRTLQAAGALQITASHNPAEWNGLKLFGNDGRILSAAEGRKVQALFEAGATPNKSWRELGSCQDYRRAEDDHRDKVLSLVDVPRIQTAKLWAFVDANGGAGGPLARKLLQALQVQTFGQGMQANGDFLHEPEPTAENLHEIGPAVTQHAAHIGFALDPDSDRLALLDETGRYIGEELTLALVVRFRLSRERGPVVVNMSTSRVVEDLAAKYGCPFYRSAVGEANVADRMIEVGAAIGGEGNGGVIDPRVGLVRDPFIGMGLILNLMAETGKKLSELVAELPAYHIVKDKYTVARDRLPQLFAALPQRWPDAKVDTLDGLRLDWQDRWVHVRSSNTEPIVRVIAEAPRATDAQALCREVGALIMKK